MNQSEFQKALQKYEKGKVRRARAEVAALEKKEEPKPQVEAVEKKSDPALPFVQLPEVKVKAPKPEYKAPKLPVMTVTFEGPVPMKFTVDYAGTLMGGQLNEQALKPLIKKALSALGRVN